MMCTDAWDPSTPAETAAAQDGGKVGVKKSQPLRVAEGRRTEKIADSQMTPKSNKQLSFRARMDFQLRPSRS